MWAPVNFRLEGADFRVGVSFLVNTLLVQSDVKFPSLCIVTLVFQQCQSPGGSWVILKHPNPMVTVWIFQSGEKVKELVLRYNCLC